MITGFEDGGRGRGHEPRDAGGPSKLDSSKETDSPPTASRSPALLTRFTLLSSTPTRQQICVVLCVASVVLCHTAAKEETNMVRVSRMIVNANKRG